MKFDVIIGNPPYQLSDAGYGRSATPIYHHFVRQAKKLNPRYLVMIIPSRWFAGGKGLDEFRAEMLGDRRIREIHDYPDATNVFPGVQIKGGVCFFLWKRDGAGDCKVVSNNPVTGVSIVERPLLEPGAEVFIRFNEAIPILRKVRAFQEGTLDRQVSSRKPFGFPTTFKGMPSAFPGSVKLYQNGGIGFVAREDVQVNKELIDKYKVLVPALASGSDAFPHPILGKPFVAEPGSACTETYIIAGAFETFEEAKSLVSYICTRFFRFLVLLSKPAQHATAKVYRFVPAQSWDQTWTDEELYKKYGLTQDEIAFIESMVRPMDNGEEITEDDK